MGEITILTLIFNLIYLIADLASGGSLIIIVYILNILLFSLTFYSNRTGYFETAKIILLYTILISVYLFGSNNVQNTETYLLYLPLILLAFTVNGYEGRYFSIAFSVVALLLYFLDVFSEFSLFSRLYLNPPTLQLMSTLNFIIAMIGLVYISYFLMKTNFLSEKSLVFRQRRLNQLTKDLRTSQQRYELAMTGTNAGIWDWDLVENRIYHGPKWKEMLGYSEHEFNQVSIDEIYDLIHPEDVENVKKAVREHLEKDSPFEMEYRMCKKDGTYEWFYDAGKAIFDGNNKPLRMVGSIINITKRKMVEEKTVRQNDLLEKANAELDRFLYITSHDLKAPLLSIEGLINLAQISEDAAEIELCLKMMKERINGLQNFIADIIDYSRNVRVGLINEEIDLRKLVEAIYEELYYIENAEKIDFRIDIEDDFKFISDEKRINVILKNLISNAIKYQNRRRRKPSIIVSAYEEDNQLLISIKDNGDGIEPEIQEKVYDMFYRGSEKSSGSGLGLYIVKEMVSQLEGNIELESEVGKGSEFKLTLPVKIVSYQ